MKNKINYKNKNQPNRERFLFKALRIVKHICLNE